MNVTKKHVLNVIWKNGADLSLIPIIETGAIAIADELARLGLAEIYEQSDGQHRIRLTPAGASEVERDDPRSS
jgi:hypothetical protein